MTNDLFERGGIVGTRVKLPRTCPFCGSNVHLVGLSRAMHANATRCDACGKHSGWLSQADVLAATEMITRHGRDGVSTLEGNNERP